MTGGGEPPLYVNGEAHRGVDTIDFDDAGEAFVSGGWEGRVTLWRVGDGAGEDLDGKPGVVRSWHAHEGWVHGVAFVNANLIVSGGYDGMLRLWDRHGRPRLSADTGSPVTRLRMRGGDVVTGHADGGVRVWDARTLSKSDEYLVHDEGWVVALAAHAASGRIASSGSGGKVFVLTPGREPRALPVPPRKAFGLSFSPAGTLLYGAGFRLLYHWPLEGGNQPQYSEIVTPHWGTINGLHYIEALDLIASVSRTNDSSVLLLDPQTGRLVRKLRRLGLCGTELSVSDNGRYLASAGEDGPLRLWDLGLRPQSASTN